MLEGHRGRDTIVVKKLLKQWIEFRTRAQGPQMKLTGSRFKTTKNYFFKQWAINIWNTLGKECNSI